MRSNFQTLISNFFPYYVFSLQILLTHFTQRSTTLSTLKWIDGTQLKFLNVTRFVSIITLIGIVVIFWFPIGGRSINRADWIGLLNLFIPLIVLRILLAKKFLTPSPLWWVIAVFFVLAGLNIYFAPYTQGFALLARPIMGVLIIYVLTEIGQSTGTLKHITRFTIWFCIAMGILALLLTQWNEKSIPFNFILDLIPKLRTLPGFEGGFNANELAGALCWALPFCAAIAIQRWRDKVPAYSVTIAFVLLLLALLFGQSRTAMVGILVALALLISLLIPRGKWRNRAWIGWGLLLVLQLFLIFNPAQRELLDDRDEVSFRARLYMWQSGLDILQDYPFTGVGMNMYRTGTIRQQYPVQGYENRVLPHIHNEVMQIAVDMGIPGILVFLGIYATVAYMVYYCWRYGDSSERAVSLGALSGLLAHAIFGLADAIPLWDRFAFIYWYMLGLISVQYTLVVAQRK